MVYAFSEEEKQRIESYGMMVVEFKRFTEKYNIVLGDLAHALEKFADMLKKAISFIASKWDEMIDTVKFYINSIREAYGYRTSLRYKVVKILSKCTGIEKLDIWKMTRHIWRPRSCC